MPHETNFITWGWTWKYKTIHLDLHHLIWYHSLSTWWQTSTHSHPMHLFWFSCRSVPCSDLRHWDDDILAATSCWSLEVSLQTGTDHAVLAKVRNWKWWQLKVATSSSPTALRCWGGCFPGAHGARNLRFSWRKHHVSDCVDWSCIGPKPRLPIQARGQATHVGRPKAPWIYWSSIFIFWTWLHNVWSQWNAA